jgi:flagellar biosynthesis protein FlhG
MPVVIAVASGKGGTGKSLLAGNMSLLLATLGKRVIAVDASPGGAGLHGWLGIGEPRRALAHALIPGGVPLSEVVMATAIPGLGLVPGEPVSGWRGELDERAAESLAGQLATLDTDYVVIDLPSGCSRFVVDLFLAADAGLLVLVPEPSSADLGYRFLRAAFARRLELAGRAHLLGADALPMPLDVFERAPEILPEMQALRASVALNCVRSKADTELGRGIATAAGRRLGLALRFLGHVDYDDAVWVSLRRRRALLVEHPESRAAKCIEKVLRRLLSRDADHPLGAREQDPARPETHYEVLEIEPTASDEEIRRAHRRVRQMFGRESVAVSGLWNREGLDAQQRRFDEAYAILMDPVRRKAYDLALFPEGVPVVPQAVLRRRETLSPPRPPPPPLAPDVDLSGQVMKGVRERLGIELREISERTKIGTSYLGAIEEEAFDRLPAPVYVRGFLVEYAKMLGLDVSRVLETYYQRFLAVRQGAGEEV